MRSTRSPRSIKNRSKDPDTCRQSSSAQTRSSPSSRAHDNSPPNPARPTWTVRSPTNSPVAAPTPAIVCERLWVSAPSTIMALVLSDRGSTAGGHGLLGALPRSLSVRGARVNCWAVATGVGGACARVVIRVVCARAPSLISAAVLPCGRTGDMMVVGHRTGVTVRNCGGVAARRSGYGPVAAGRWALTPRATRNSAATSLVAASAPSGNT